MKAIWMAAFYVVLRIIEAYLEHSGADARTRMAYDEFLRQLGDQAPRRGMSHLNFERARQKNLAKIMQMGDDGGV